MHKEVSKVSFKEKLVGEGEGGNGLQMHELLNAELPRRRPRSQNDNSNGAAEPRNQAQNQERKLHQGEASAQAAEHNQQPTEYQIC